MADYQSIYTGQEIDSAVGKASKLPTVSASDSGKALQVDANGNIVAVASGGSGGTQLYKHTIYLGEPTTDDLLYLIIVSTRDTAYTLSELSTIFSTSDFLFNGMGGTNSRNTNVVSSIAGLKDVDTARDDKFYCNFYVTNSSFVGIGFQTGASTPTLTKDTFTISASNLVDTVTTFTI